MKKKMIFHSENQKYNSNITVENGHSLTTRKTLIRYK